MKTSLKKKPQQHKPNGIKFKLSHCITQFKIISVYKESLTRNKNQIYFSELWQHIYHSRDGSSEIYLLLFISLFWYPKRWNWPCHEPNIRNTRNTHCLLAREETLLALSMPFFILLYYISSYSV